MQQKEQIEPFSMIVIGQTRVGKSTQNENEIDVYTSSHGGKVPQKVLIFDINNEQIYRKYRTLDPTPENIRKFILQKTIEARRIACVNSDGSPMRPKEKQELLKVVIQNYRNGLFAIDDIDKVAIFSRDQDMVGMLMGNAHVGLSVMITKQSIGMVSRYEFRNLTYIRLHKTTDSVKMIRSRAVNYELIRIAELIIDEQYHVLKNIRFFLYIDMRMLQIKGCSRAAFNRACRKYAYEEKRLVADKLNAMIMDEVIRPSERKNPQSIHLAIDRIIEDHKHFIPEHIVQ